MNERATGTVMDPGGSCGDVRVEPTSLFAGYRRSPRWLWMRRWPPLPRRGSPRRPGARRGRWRAVAPGRVARGGPRRRSTPPRDLLYPCFTGRWQTTPCAATRVSGGDHHLRAAARHYPRDGHEPHGAPWPRGGVITSGPKVLPGFDRRRPPAAWTTSVTMTTGEQCGGRFDWLCGATPTAGAHGRRSPARGGAGTTAGSRGDRRNSDNAAAGRVARGRARPPQALASSRMASISSSVAKKSRVCAREVAEDRLEDLELPRQSDLVGSVGRPRVVCLPHEPVGDVDPLIDHRGRKFARELVAGDAGLEEVDRCLALLAARRLVLAEQPGNPVH